MITHAHLDDTTTMHLKKADFKHLGEIKFTLRLCRQMSEPSPLLTENPFRSGKGKIPEKCLKGRAISSRAT